MLEAASLFGTPRQWAIDLAIMTAVGVFFGVIGPFGTFSGGPAELRVVFWVVNSWMGLTVLSVVVRLSIRLSNRIDLPVWFTLAVGVAVGVLPLSIGLAYFGAWFWPPDHGQLPPLLRQYGEVLALSEPVAFVYFYVAYRGWRGTMRRGPKPGESPRPFADEANPGGRFLDRLPPSLGRDLICLQMEDHYVRAHTAFGSNLILTPMKIAVAELGGVEGMQVHRSWWVAKAAVVQAESEGRNLSLRLSNGLDAPVSRAYVAKLRSAGWLDAPSDPGRCQP